MRISHSDIMMIEALLDGELTGEDASRARNIMDDNPKLQQFYDALKFQKELIKTTYLLSDKTH